MPDPINFTPAQPYPLPEEPELTCQGPALAPRLDEAAGGTRGHASAKLPEGRDSKTTPRSCLSPALKTVATCGTIALSQGVGVLLAGAACIASASDLDDCLAARRRR